MSNTIPHTHEHLIRTYKRCNIMQYERETLTESAKVFMFLFQDSHNPEFLNRAIHCTRLALSVMREQRKLKRV